MSEKAKPVSRSRCAAIILGAGFGTRLTISIQADPAFRSLLGIPKPLLPLGGRVLLDRWLEQFEKIPEVEQVLVVSNLAHLEHYKRWHRRISSSKEVELCHNAATCNENRSGAVQDIMLGINTLKKMCKSRSMPFYDAVVIAAGDTLLPKTDVKNTLDHFLQACAKHRASVGVYSYQLRDLLDCVNRGMISHCVRKQCRHPVQGCWSQVVDLVEKPTPEECPSNLAAAPAYIFHCSVIDQQLVELFLREKQFGPLKERDAPGFLIKFLCRRTFVLMLHVEDDFRIDIGNLTQYKDALEYYQSLPNRSRMLEEPARGVGYPRVGLLGNPSDGYFGQTISMAISNLGIAEVIAYPSQSFSILTNPEMEHPCEFQSISNMASHFENHGINYGAKKLVVAGVVLFQRLVSKPSANPNLARVMDSTPCSLAYSSSIPRMRGLAGSSALIWATVQSLCVFYRISPFELYEKDQWPYHMLCIERDFLGIPCGLQDRVAQVYLGLIYMDFRCQPPVYMPLDETISRLPPLYIAYKEKDSGCCSGKVHSNLRVRYDAGDLALKQGMDRIGNIAREGKKELMKDCIDSNKLGSLMEQNWLERVKMLGEDGVGQDNLKLVSECKEVGFKAKLSGSGGACVCIVADSVEHGQGIIISGAKAKLGKKGIRLERLQVKAPLC